MKASRLTILNFFLVISLILPFGIFQGNESRVANSASAQEVTKLTSPNGQNPTPPPPVPPVNSAEKDKQQAQQALEVVLTKHLEFGGLYEANISDVKVKDDWAHKSEMALRTRL
jgi:hypothetical protein